MASKFVDTTAIMQVIGSVYNNPQLLDLTDKYTIVEEDFPDEFHKIAFGTIYKICLKKQISAGIRGQTKLG